MVRGLPVMIRSENAGRVTGELYKVTPATMKRLDSLEGHPDFYTRQQIRLDDGSTAQAYLWTTDPSEEKDVAEIESGDWTA